MLFAKDMLLLFLRSMFGTSVFIIICTERIHCDRHCSRPCGFSSELNKVPTFIEITGYFFRK